MKSFSKRDGIFILIVIFAVAVFFILINFVFKKDASFVELSVNGELIETYSLSEDGTFKVFENNIINNFEIKDGKVRMIEADCPDGTCKRQGSISKHNETIVCLPHKVILRAVDEKDTKDSLDTVVK